MTGWLRSMRRWNPGAPAWKLALWHAVRNSLGLMLMVMYRFRSWGGMKVPTTGPVLLVANHQSVYDPPALAMAIPHRQFRPMARKTLFGGSAFGKLIAALGAFPVDQDKADLKAIRTAIDLLKQGHAVLIFAEGSRTPDGCVHEFQDGVMLVIRRARPTVVPIAIEGNYDVYPIGSKRPTLTGRVGVLCGDPISADALLAMKGHGATTHLRRTVERLRMDLRGRLRAQSHGKWPRKGPADEPWWNAEAGKQESRKAGNAEDAAGASS